MSRSIPARIFIVALCIVSIAIALDSLLVRQFASRVLRRCGISLLPVDDVPDHASIFLRAILDAPHSWELIVKGVLHWLMFWAVVGASTLLHHVRQPGLDLCGFLGQRLSCFMMSSLSGLCALLVHVPRSLVTVPSSSSLSLSPQSKHSHVRSPSRVAEIAF